MIATAPPHRVSLPCGFVVQLGDTVRSADGGRTLFGGSPPRLLYLKPRAQHLIAAGGRLHVTDTTSASLARLLLDRGLGDPVVTLGLPGIPRAGDVTVVVPVKDRPRELGRLLRSLPHDVQVIVVDDGSRDGTTAGVAADAGARVLNHRASRGPAAARNTGLRAVRTPIVAFLDSDVVPRDGWLDALLAHFADPAVGVVAPRIAALNCSDRGLIARYEAARSSLDLGPAASLVAPRGRVAYVPSACLVGRVEAFGVGFDDAMTVAEDVDLIWRTIKAGWRVRYEPGAVVDHDHRVRAGDWLARKAFYGTGAAPLAHRHHRAVAPVVASPWTAAVAVAALTQRRWSLPIGAAITVGATWRLSRRLTGSDHRLRAAAALAPYGVTSAIWQIGAALTRHWWPVAAAACAFSPRARRAVLAAAIVDGLADWLRVRPHLDPARYVVLRRLDDLAYGAGLWAGAVQHRSLAPLLPDVVS